MPRNPVRRKKTVLNPAFAIPEGVDEIVYDDTYQDSFFDEDPNNDDEGGGRPVLVEDDGKPDTPDYFKIIKQDLQGKGNNQVVDVVAEVETVNGVVRYEYRLTKVD